MRCVCEQVTTGLPAATFYRECLAWQEYNLQDIPKGLLKWTCTGQKRGMIGKRQAHRENSEQ